MVELRRILLPTLKNNFAIGSIYRFENQSMEGMAELFFYPKSSVNGLSIEEVSKL